MSLFACLSCACRVTSMLKGNSRETKYRIIFRMFVHLFIYLLVYNLIHKHPHTPMHVMCTFGHQKTIFPRQLSFSNMWVMKNPTQVVRLGNCLYPLNYPASSAFQMPSTSYPIKFPKLQLQWDSYFILHKNAGGSERFLKSYWRQRSKNGRLEHQTEAICFQSAHG